MIECKVTNDYDAIKDIYKHESIWPLINKGLPKNSALIPLDAINIGMYINGKLTGLIVYTRYEDGLECHPMVKKQYRRKSKRFFKKALSMVNCTVYARFPRSRKDLFNLANKLGFQLMSVEEGNTLNMRLDK